jgi:hypothetical protein
MRRGPALVATAGGAVAAVTGGAWGVHAVFADAYYHRLVPFGDAYGNHCTSKQLVTHETPKLGAMRLRRVAALMGAVALVMGACGRGTSEVRTAAGSPAAQDSKGAATGLPAFTGRLVVYDPNDVDGTVRTWELVYVDQEHWRMTESRKVVEDAEAVGMPVPYSTVTMEGDHYLEVQHDLADISGVPPDVRAQYEPTFMQLPLRDQYALLVEGMRRGWVKLISHVEGEATGSPPIPPTPLFELVTPYPPTWGGTPVLARSETVRDDGTRVVTLRGRLTCQEVRLSPALCGGSTTRRDTVVRTYDVRPDGIPVRFSETFGGRTTRVITLDDVVLN